MRKDKREMCDGDGPICDGPGKSTAVCSICCESKQYHLQSKKNLSIPTLARLFLAVSILSLARS